ncbi:MAG: RNA polymerase sigma factor [Bacillota bacterium]|jgi:RNA polymerase sigma factor (sigma-70 family)
MTGGEPLDDQIIELIKSRKDEGFRLLRQQYSRRMNYIVRSILRDPADTEDCISDIHEKIWRSIEDYCPEKGSFSAWLTAISRNTALNYSRRKDRSHDRLKHDMVDTQTPSPEDNFLRQEQIVGLKRALSALSPGERRMFYRKYYYLQPTSQIAAELGLTERAVEGKLYRLRKKLQERLGRDLT